MDDLALRCEPSRAFARGDATAPNLLSIHVLTRRRRNRFRVGCSVRRTADNRAMSYRAIQLYFCPFGTAPEYQVGLTTQIERALQGVPRQAIVSISYAPYPHREDDMLALIVLEEP